MLALSLGAVLFQLSWQSRTPGSWPLLISGQKRVFDVLRVPRVWERTARATVLQKELFFFLLESKTSHRSVNVEPRLCLVLGKGYILR